MKALATLHKSVVHQRRVQVLAWHFARLLPAGATVLDVGCGDGRLDHAIQLLRPDLVLEGVDVTVRPRVAIPVNVFDGKRLPATNASFDVVMFSDVLHHTTDPMVLLKEAVRVARLGVAIKDHLREGFLARATLSIMDWVGNAPHGVALPYNYWTRSQWDAAFARLGLRVDAWETQLGLYAASANWLFGRSLHFVAFLECESRAGLDGT